ncbi:AI-2E family transporter [Niallia sp. Sow4_A1]|uniref:AI-2E family transporter n=1 Tax=Niallia sp. Sow4_A1 TaxID=3438793 RepID=UPI003F99716C
MVGPWIGAIPSVIVRLLHSPMQAIIVLVIVVIIQQMESLFVQPQIIGKRMSIHPVTVMVLVLVAGRFIGVIGMVLVIPIFAIVKVIVTHTNRLWRIRQEEKILKKTPAVLDYHLIPQEFIYYNCFTACKFLFFISNCLNIT